jgi:cation diffusion facilitator CzcD-associated flavoprotein CzcO
MKTNTIIIGAGAAGLSCAVCLERKKIPFILLDKSEKIGSEWSHRYDRLHLHTPRYHSSLPYFKIPGHHPKYLSKNDFAAYLNEYAEKFNIKPKFNQKVIEVKEVNKQWEVITETDKFHGLHLIIATGYARKPVQPHIEGIENFQGDIIHSSQYKNGEKYKNKNVLVVGFGNSACEIGICLYEHKAFPALSVRGGVNILPRDIAGISLITIAIGQQWLTKLSTRMTDLINRPLLRFITGDEAKLGLKKLPYGAMTQIIKYKKIPLIDVGTVKLIKEKKIEIYPGIKKITSEGVEFTNGKQEDFDAIIFATGYEPGLDDFLQGKNNPISASNDNNLSNVYFCGFNISPTGMLRKIAIDAKEIAERISKASATISGSLTEGNYK